MRMCRALRGCSHHRRAASSRQTTIALLCPHGSPAVAAPKRCSPDNQPTARWMGLAGCQGGWAESLSSPAAEKLERGQMKKGGESLEEQKENKCGIECGSGRPAWDTPWPHTPVWGCAVLALLLRLSAPWKQEPLWRHLYRVALCKDTACISVSKMRDATSFLREQMSERRSFFRRPRDPCWFFFWQTYWIKSKHF